MRFSLALRVLVLGLFSCSWASAQEQAKGVPSSQPRAWDVKDVKPGSAQDLQVRASIKDAEGGEGCVVSVVVTNVSTSTVRVYVPALIGVMEAARTDREAIPLQLGVATRKDAGDWVYLRTGEFFGRSHRLGGSGASSRALAFYTVFAEGREGHTDSIVATVHSDGRISYPDRR